MVGSTIDVYFNGSLVATRNDSTHAGAGSIGIDLYGTATSADDFGGGNVSVDSTTSGTMYFDAFESRRSSYIGPLAYQAPNYAFASEDQTVDVSYPFTSYNAPQPVSAPLAQSGPTFLQAAFTYDGDGRRVKSEMTTDVGTTTTYFVSNHYEVDSDGKVTKYYYAGAQKVAMREYTMPQPSTLTYLLGDHLGSTSITTDSTGNLVSEMRYKPWGEERYSSGSTSTEYTYTGQYSNVDDFGLMFYNARWYDSAIGRFTQPDTLIPSPMYSQAWDRYSYTYNNPLTYTDPTGHDPVLDFIGGFLKEVARTNLWFHPGAQKDLAIQNNESTAELAGRLVADVASMVVGVVEAGGGTGVAGGGVAVCATGVGCPAGAAAIAGGGVLIAQGAGTTLNAANGAGTVLAMLSNGNSNGSPSDLVGRDFENWLAKKLGGTGPFKSGGREFDVATEDQWIEAKSGNYWEKFDFEEFKNSMGAHNKIAAENGKAFELHSNTAIPRYVKDWLDKKGIPYVEYLGK